VVLYAYLLLAGRKQPPPPSTVPSPSGRGV
jgi:hypothetical protein